MRLLCPVCRKFFEPIRRDAVTCSVRCRVARQRELQASTPPWPEGIFDLVVVDLPLRWTGRSPKGEGRSPQRHYATMDIPALIRCLRPMLGSCMAKNCAAGFWVCGPRLPDTLKVIEGVAFIYKSELLTWFKTGRIGMGKTTRKVVENMWLATRGAGLRILDHGVRQNIDTEEEEELLPLTIEAPRRENSVKPDEAYQALERLYGDVRRLELFARRRRPGWTVWGNEVVDLVPAAAD
jgi:N6-adenosine-specific RNA methylase IME4